MFKISLHLTVYRYEAIVALIILLLTGSIIVSSKDDERSFPPPQRYPYQIALTFDDGPHPHFTESIISILRAEDVKATFFLVGTKMTEHPSLAARLAVEHHELAGHTFSHRNLSKLSREDIRRELQVTKQLIVDLARQDSMFFRPPGGQYDRDVLSVAEEMGLSMVLWTVFPKDHEEKSADKIVEKVLAQATDRGVVLLHSGRPATLQALPKIIRELKRRGYRFSTISQLYQSSKRKQLAWLK